METAKDMMIEFMNEFDKYPTDRELDLLWEEEQVKQEYLREYYRENGE